MLENFETIKKILPTIFSTENYSKLPYFVNFLAFTI